MITKITHRHFCNLGALNNPGCFSRWNEIVGNLEYFYHGNLSEACWMGWRNLSPGKP